MPQRNSSPFLRRGATLCEPLRRHMPPSPSPTAASQDRPEGPKLIASSRLLSHRRQRMGAWAADKPTRQQTNRPSSNESDGRWVRGFDGQGGRKGWEGCNVWDLLMAPKDSPCREQDAMKSFRVVCCEDLLANRRFEQCKCRREDRSFFPEHGGQLRPSEGFP